MEVNVQPHVPTVLLLSTQRKGSLMGHRSYLQAVAKIKTLPLSGFE